MIDHILQGLLLVSGAIAMLLVSSAGRGTKWGWLIGAAFQPLWLYVTWSAGQWGMFVLSCVYTWCWCYGTWNHWRPRRGWAR